MSNLKRYRDQNVLEAARERLEFVFDEFDHVYLSVSAGKDSSVMMQLARQVAEQRDASFDVLFVDLEAQYRATIDHMETLIENSQHVLDDVYWICLPLSLRNAVSQIQPKWTCWNRDEREKWVRELPDRDDVFHEGDHPFDFFKPHMEFEEFIDEFARCRPHRAAGRARRHPGRQPRPGRLRGRTARLPASHNCQFNPESSWFEGIRATKLVPEELEPE